MAGRYLKKVEQERKHDCHPPCEAGGSGHVDIDYAWRPNSPRALGSIWECDCGAVWKCKKGFPWFHKLGESWEMPWTRVAMWFKVSEGDPNFGPKRRTNEDRILYTVYNGDGTPFARYDTFAGAIGSLWDRQFVITDDGEVIDKEWVREHQLS